MTDPAEREPDDAMPWRVRIVVACLILAQLVAKGLIRLSGGICQMAARGPGRGGRAEPPPAVPRLQQ